MDFAERVENGDTSLQTHKGTRDTPVTVITKENVLYIRNKNKALNDLDSHGKRDEK